MYDPIKTSRILEAFLYTIAVLVFVILLVVQITIQYPKIRNALVWQDSLEGSLLSKEEYLFASTIVDLWLEDTNEFSGDNIKILVNGDETSDFQHGEVSLKVANGDVIEVDGSNVSMKVAVNVETIPYTIETGSIHNRIIVDSNVVKIGKVKMIEQK